MAGPRQERTTDMLDLTSRDTLPKDEFGKVAIPLDVINTAEPSNMGPLLNSGLADVEAEEKENDYNAILQLLRNDYYELCRFFIDPVMLEHGHYGDDCGDYRNAAGEAMTWLHSTFGWAMWHSELREEHINELNDWLNCVDEDHCIHQWSLDGPNLKLDELAIDWESCPLMQD